MGQFQLHHVNGIILKKYRLVNYRFIIWKNKISNYGVVVLAHMYKEHLTIIDLSSL